LVASAGQVSRARRLQRLLSDDFNQGAKSGRTGSRNSERGTFKIRHVTLTEGMNQRAHAHTWRSIISIADLCGFGGGFSGGFMSGGFRGFGGFGGSGWRSGSAAAVDCLSSGRK
jgi:hypothetical protein